MATLYDIAEEIKELLDLMQSAEVDEQTIQDTIEATGLKDDFKNKIDGYLYVIDDIEASNKRIRKEEKRLAERRRMQEQNIIKMKRSIQDTMLLLNKQKERTDKYTVWVQNNPPKLVVEDESEIPKAYWIEQAPKLDRKSLLNDLKGEDHTDFKGARVVQERSLRIK